MKKSSKKPTKAEYEYRSTKLQAMLDDPRLHEVAKILPLFIPLYQAASDFAMACKDTEIDNALHKINDYLDQAPRVDDREAIRKLKERFNAISALIK